MAHVKKMDKIVPLMPCLCFVFFRLAADEEVGAGEAVGYGGVAAAGAGCQ